MLFGTAPLSGFKDLHLPKGILTGAFNTIVSWIDGFQLKLSALALETSGQCGTNVYWTFDETTGTLTISGEGPMRDYKSYSTSPFNKNISIKSLVILNGVTKIGEYAFNGCNSMTEISIPESIISIGDNAFSGCSGLNKVIYSGSASDWCRIEFVGYSSNPNCYAKNIVFQAETDQLNIVLDNDLTVINNYAFCYCDSLTSIIIPDSIKEIGNYAFYDCTKLKYITIPNGVTQIGSYAFRCCENLIKICIPDSVRNIGDSAFDNCTALTDLEYTGTASDWCQINFGNLSSPNRYAKKIEFQGEANQSEFILSDKVTTIPEYAFCNFIELKSITIPDSVTSIGKQAFKNCDSLNVSAYKGTASQWCKVSFADALSNPSWYTEKIIFANEENQSNILLDNTVTTINGYAFIDCTKLTNITIPNSVTTIGSSAFYGCTGLTTITIPKSVTKINAQAFRYCDGLTEFIYAGTASDWLVVQLDGSYSNPNHCAKNIVFQGEKDAANLSIDNRVTTIPDFAFYGCTKLVSITLPNSITDIGEHAFNECKNLKSINIPNSVTSIGLCSFSNCKSIATINIPESVISIGDRAFYGCTGLTDITIPNSITGIRQDVFNGCTGLTSVTISDSVTSIGAQAFSNCISLTDVKISKNLKSIGNYAFSGCKNIFSISIPDSVTYIGIRAFSSVRNLIYTGTAEGSPWGAAHFNKFSDGRFLFNDSSKTNLVECNRKLEGDLVIPDSITSIGRIAFNGCTGLTSIKIPNSVKSIDSFAFSGVNNIIYSDNWYNNVMHGQGSPWGAKAVDAYVEGDLYYYDSSKELLLGCSPQASGPITLPDTVEEVGDNCFLGCENITSLSFSSPVYFADTALSGCNNLQSVIAPSNTDNFGVVYTKPFTNDSISTASVSDGNLSIEYDTGILFCDKFASGNYSVPEEITYICENAFANCRSVSVDMDNNNNIKSIGAYAFFNSKNYIDWFNTNDNVLIIGGYLVAAKSSISGTYTVPSGVKGIADKAFAGCSSLTGFMCGIDARFLGNGVFSGCSARLKNNLTFSTAGNLEYINGDIFDTDTNTETEKETKEYNNVLLSVSPDVETYTIGNKITTIASSTFEGCTKLKSITIPANIKKIDRNTFRGCTNLSSVIFEGNITEIGDNAFADCISLSEITIPASVEKIGHLAFYGCIGMESFNVEPENTNYKSEEGVLMSKDGKTIIQYPAAKDGTNYSITSGMAVADLAFYRSRKLLEIAIADNVMLGNRNPFAACTAKFNSGKMFFRDAKKTILTSVSASVTGKFNVPMTVVEIGSDALRECTGITEVNFSQAFQLSKIGDYAFYGCTGLTAITIPKTVTVIGASAFENCVNLKTVTFEKSNGVINNKLQKIGDYAFCNCPCNEEGGSCNSKILKAKELTIGKNAFSNSFADSINVDKNGLIYCINPELYGVNKYVNTDYHISATQDTERIGTGSCITIFSKDRSEIPSAEVSYTAVVFGDTNGDGWYDGMDAITVSCLANGILKKDNVSTAVYTAADCNHDGVIDQLDVDILQQAGVLLASVDQTKSEKELLETSSAYVEYLNLIDQTVGTEDIQADDSNDDNVEPDESTTHSNPFEFILDFVMKIFSLIKSIFTFNNGVLINK